MVPSDNAWANSYLSIVTKSPSAALWSQFLMEGFTLNL